MPCSVTPRFSLVIGCDRWFFTDLRCSREVCYPYVMTNITKFFASVVPYDLGEDYWRTAHNGTQIRLYSKHQHGVTNFSLLFIGPEGSGRRKHGGPIVPGPYAALIAQATVISLHRFEKAPVVELKEGDVIEIRGFEFEIRDDVPMYDPKLYLI